MLEQFHFLQPLWLLALLPLAVLVWLVNDHRNSDNPWRHIVDRRLLPLLLGKQQTTMSSSTMWLLSTGWLLAVLALANPAWEQQPQPVFQTGVARVIVLDLSRSMLAADLAPSRLVRARFKVEDMLAFDDEGQTGLVVFAGDAFSVTPLTRDTDTIRAQLKALEPAIMPSQGSRADLGLFKAQELLQQAGVRDGRIILVADGVEGDMARTAAAEIRRAGYRVSVMGIGTTAGAPLPDGHGGTVKDGSGNPLLVKLDEEALHRVARAGGGHYCAISGNSDDIRYLLDTASSNRPGLESSDMQTQKWKEQGPLLAALLLPLAAFAFRRGWLLGMMLCVSMLSLTRPQPAMALGWDDLWLRNDQQAAQALQQEKYEQAAKLADDPAQRGSAEYKKGDYRKALEAFKAAGGSDAAYNRGNALARLGKYHEAIDAYEESLRMQPGMEDAVANKAAVEELLKKQQRQQNRQDSSGQQNEQDQNADRESGAPDPDKSENGEPGNKDNTGNETKQSENSEQSETGQQQSAEQSENTDSDEQQDSQDNQFSDAGKKMDEGKSDHGENGEHGASALPEAGNEERRPAQPEEDQQPAVAGQAPEQAEPLTSEEQLAAQQWLRRIPDDPGGLLRRKFLYQYQQRDQQVNSGIAQQW